MKKIKVKRHQQQTFTYLDERFCSHCGTKGVYKNGCDEHEELYCFACNDSRPYMIYDADHTLPKLMAREPKVVDARVWEAEISPLEKLVEDSFAALSRKMSDDLYSAPPSTGILGLANLVGSDKPIELITPSDYKKGWSGD
jgi:hypothetical protein